MQSNEMSMPEIVGHYNEGREQDRLVSGVGQLELARSQELLLRFLPSPPAAVLDVGGGAGVYSFWLAAREYQVHLVDATPMHIEQAQRRTEGGMRQATRGYRAPIASASPASG